MALNRFIIGVPLGALVTVALFFIMQALIAQDQLARVDETESFVIDISRDIRDESSDSSRRELTPPDQVEEPPEPPKVDPTTQIDSNIDSSGVSLPNVGGVGGELTFGGLLDGDVQPIVRIEPEYPQRAAQRGLEGYVIVEFTIQVDGTVSDVSVVESSSSIFDRAAVRAVLRWKYRPQIVDGEPRVRPGVRTRIEFKLDPGNGRR